MRRLARTAAMLVAAAGALALVRVPLASGAYVARVANSTTTAASNPYFTCAAAALGETGTKAVFAYPFSDAVLTLTAADATGNNRAGTYSLLGVTRQVTDAGVCPRDGGRVVTLDGANGLVSGYGGIAGPQVFSEEIWFKTTVKGGKLIGFGNSQTGTSTQYDRHLYVDADGQVTFGAYDGAQTYTISSAAGTSLADGAWHQAVGTMSGAGMRLYVDGRLAGTNANTVAETVATGWWRIGYDNIFNWPDSAPPYYFKGSLAWASVYAYALSATQVAQHYAAGR